MEKSDGSCPETEKIGKLMGKYAIPCIISLLVGAVAAVLICRTFRFLNDKTPEKTGRSLRKG